MPFKKLTLAEVLAALEAHKGSLPPTLDVKGFAALLDKRPKTVNHWIQKGILKPAVRKIGRGYLIWVPRALLALFNQDNKEGS